MKGFISAQLAGNRKGRFLTSLLDVSVVSMETLPDNGLIILTGEEWHQNDHQEQYLNWCIQPGRVLLLIPPFTSEPLFTSASPDWQIQQRDNAATGHSDPLGNILASEVTSCITGFDGDSQPQHCWADGSLHTRYLRKHSNSGMLVVTCLPLWSISLLTEQEPVINWLGWFLDHAGKAIIEVEKSDHKFIPDKLDFNLLLCAYSFNCGLMDEVIAINSQLGLFNFEKMDIQIRWPELSSQGLIERGGLTPAGQSLLEASPFWLYAQALKQQLNKGKPE